MEGLTRRELVLGAGALALGAGDAFAMPARDPGWGVPAPVRRAGGARPRVLRELARRVRGPVLRPGAAAYASAARVYNARFDGAAPDAVVEPLDSRDVQAVLRWADRHDVRVAARSGGHSYAGYSTLGVGVVVDLRRLRSIAVDRGGQRAHAGAGAHTIEVVDALARHGGAVPLGSCPTVGLGGLALGGGYGLASRAWGLTADNVAGIVVVTPDGRLRRVDRRDDADLFWALRGGGGGNFGIATRFELRVHHARQAAWFRGSLPDAAAAIAAWQAWAPHTDPRLTALLQLGTNGAVDVLGQHLGSQRELDRLLAPLRRAGASLTTGVSAYGPLQVRWANGRTSPRTTFSAKSHYVRHRLPALARDALVAELHRGTAGLDTGMLLLDAYGGALNRPHAGATAFAHRDEAYSIQYLAYHSGDGAASRAWLRRMHRIVAPHASGAYQNYMDPDLPGWRRAYYGRNLARLEAVRERCDPDGRFRFARAV
jgi:FAD/FMN-containing dehydrogenase